MLLISLIQSQPATRMPWGVMVASALIVLLGVLLLVFFFRRFKKTEKEADTEDEWGSRWGLGLNADATQQKPSKEAARTEGRTLGLGSPATDTADERVAVSETGAFGSAASQTTQNDAATEDLEPRLQPTPVVAELSPPESAKQQIREEPTVSGALPAPEQPGAISSPFGDEIWSELAPGAAASQNPAPGQHPDEASQAIRPAVSAGVLREPYEPPRIEPIVPRKQSASLAGSIPKPQEAPMPASSAAQRRSRAEVKLVQPPPPLAATTESSIDPQENEPASPVAARGHSDGALAEQITGPARLDIGTLANYGNTPDDGGGRGGTMALAGIILIIVAAIFAYVFIPSVHSTFAKLRGQGAADDTPKAQVFTERSDTTTNLWKIKGTVQNVSQDSLGDLVVGLSLEPRSEGSATSLDAAVTPDQIGAGETGNFEFQVDAQQYKGYRVIKLKTKSGKDVAFASPKSTPGVPGQ
jgi:hypothetical protein